MKNVMVALERLAIQITSGEIGTAKPWGGADVAIVASRPSETASSFYPDPRYVVTSHVKELSWLFVKLKTLFIPYYDFQSKIEFFGRLANAALRYQKQCQGTEVLVDLLGAVLHEAFTIAEEMEAGIFKSLPVAFGNEIVDDFRDETDLQ